MSIYDRFDDDDTEGVEEEFEPVVEAFSLTRRNKSDSYQYRIIEVPIDPFLLSDFPSEDGLGTQVSISGYPEELAELRQDLIREVRRLIKVSLTKRQAQVMFLRLQGKTQVEIGNKLGIKQPTVHNAINGVIDYKNGGARYGGAIKKLRKMCDRDERVQAILKRISEIRISEGDS
jgi:DNA-directed RNA polymerase specialized sigma24 family protein